MLGALQKLEEKDEDEVALSRFPQNSIPSLSLRTPRMRLCLSCFVVLVQQDIVISKEDLVLSVVGELLLGKADCESDGPRQDGIFT